MHGTCGQRAIRSGQRGGSAGALGTAARRRVLAAARRPGDPNPEMVAEPHAGPDKMNRDKLESMSYKQLQARAKKLGISANVATDKMINNIMKKEREKAPTAGKARVARAAIGKGTRKTAKLDGLYDGEAGGADGERVAGAGADDGVAVSASDDDGATRDPVDRAKLDSLFSGGAPRDPVDRAKHDSLFGAGALGTGAGPPELGGAAGAAKGAGSAGGAVNVQSSHRVKLRPPSTLNDSPSESQFKTWKLEMNYWRATMSTDHTDNAMLQCLLTALPDSAKRIIFGELETQNMSMSSVLSCLAREYGGDAILEKRDALHNYRTCKRVASESLNEFLKRFRHARQTAMLADVLVANAGTDTWDLLDACTLNATQRGNFLNQLQLRMSLDTSVSEYEHSLALLTNMSRAFGSDQTTTGTNALFSASDGGGASLGQGGGGGGQRSSEQKGAKGGWKKSPTGGWKKQPAKGGGKGGGKGSKGGGKGGKGAGKGGKGAGKGGKGGDGCHNCGAKDHWARECPVKGEGPRAGRAAQRKPDWKCSCGASCWGSKTHCFKCGKAASGAAVVSG